MKEVLTDEVQRNARIFVFPNSALKINETKINYFDFISSKDYKKYTKSLFRVVTKNH